MRFAIVAFVSMMLAVVCGCGGGGGGVSQPELIAFSSGNGIWVMRADGSYPRQLTYGNDAWPAFSRDGRRIVYSTSDRKICVVNSDGTGMRVLVSKDGLNYTPSFSADGSHIVFSVDRPDTAGLSIMNADGTNEIHVPTLVSGIIGHCSLQTVNRLSSFRQKREGEAPSCRS